ncbi:MAG: nucleotidyltransferase domain-containing protein [Magnetococcales bacterium]|nr:nucleotidyltransferase domain-containing protein [Magnetococcales bacterium]
MQTGYEVTDDMLQEMVQTIVQEVDPIRIVLFGSRAGNTARPDSDVDLLVIEEAPFGPTRSRRKEAVRLWSALKQFYVPKDILVFTEKEARHYEEVFDHVIYHAMREGRILYERPRADKNLAPDGTQGSQISQNSC